MSKIILKLSYKNACILKHALRNQIEFNEGMLRCIKKQLDKTEKSQEFIRILQREGYAKSEYNKKLKEHEEEKRALAAIIEEINDSCIKHNKAWNK